MTCVRAWVCVSVCVRALSLSLFPYEKDHFAIYTGLFWHLRTPYAHLTKVLGQLWDRALHIYTSHAFTCILALWFYFCKIIMNTSSRSLDSCEIERCAACSCAVISCSASWCVCVCARARACVCVFVRIRSCVLCVCACVYTHALSLSLTHSLTLTLTLTLSPSLFLSLSLPSWVSATSVKRDLFIWQKRPIYMEKEAYCY